MGWAKKHTWEPMWYFSFCSAATTEMSNTFRRYHPNLPSELGDYEINRQVVLACQQSGGGGRMASTFCCLLSVSKKSVWNRCFNLVEELLAKAEIKRK